MPNLAAVAANPGALSALFQQGEVDIAPHNLSSIAVLQDKGVDVEWVIPREGSYAFGASVYIVFIYQDWETSQQRSQWIERFNREVTV